MKARSAAIQGALAVAGLVAAYVTWQRPKDDADSEVVVLDVGKKDVQRIRYDDPKREVELVPSGEVTWIRHTEKPPRAAPPAPPAGADGGTSLAAADGGSTPVAGAADGGVTPAGGPATVLAAAADGGTSAADAGTAATATATPAPPRTREFRANEAAQKVVERFAPFTAVRALGTLPEEKLKELGLAQSERWLEVVTSKGTHRFRVASDTAGATSPYVRNEATGEVFVVRSTLVSDLEFASSRLVDRRLHAFKEDEYDAVVISGDGKERRLTRQATKLAEAGGAVDDFASNWHEKIWRLIGVDVLGRGETPAAGTPEVRVRVEYLRDGKSVGFIELGDAGKDVFARTEHTASWVRLHGGAEQIVTERTKVIDPKS